MVVHDNKLWVIGGTNFENDVWYSEDGEKWNCATTKASWSGRIFFAAVTFNNKIWIFGGRTTSGNSNDVWYSDDGKDWTCATDNADWAKRELLEAFVYDGKLWVAGGSEELSESLNDLWYSNDGKTWTKAPNLPGPKRRSFPSAIFNQKLWIIGGVEDKDYLNDIWYCDLSTSGLNFDDTRTYPPNPVDLRVMHSPYSYGSFTIGYDLYSPMTIRISIFNYSGRELRTMTNETKNAGSYRLVWDGCTAEGNPVAAGAYLVLMKTNTRSIIREIIKGGE